MVEDQYLVLTGEPHILMVDDDVGDLRLTREAMGRSGDDKALHFVNTGEDALEFLERKGPFQDAPRPDCVVLDLKMPGMDGLSCLRRIRSNPDFASIPVVMLTTSGSPRDEAEAMRLGATRFLTKPRDLDEYLDLVGAIGEAIVDSPRSGAP